jgi:peptide/nickel transport system substrate-binding protein
MRANWKSIGVATLAVCLMATAVDARTLKWARSGDALTLDPHAQNEGPTHNLSHHIYEPLIIRDKAGKALPALAESWSLTSDPAVWEFKLRKGVTFHDGSPFTAEDVVFSYARAGQPTSDMKGLLSSVDSVTKVDDHTVRIKTKGPNPLLPANLTDLFIMSKAWAEKNNAGKVQDFKNKEENYAVRNANGTGPFTLVSRAPDVKTVLKANANYWGKDQYKHGITELEYIVIKADATRVAALLSGEVDFVQDLPVQDVERVKGTANLKVSVGPENRSIFLGMNVGDKELKTSDAKGKNPFADKRVRQAVNMAINRDAIQRVVMRTQSIPTGTIAPPGVNGWTKEMDKYPTYDVAKAKGLMKEAGYESGFSVSFHCPNDRYINDEAICQAAVGMLGQIGVKANLVAQSKSIHFPLIQKADTDFYLLGWGVPTFDSHYIFSFLYHTRTDKVGGWNGTRYSNADVDKLTTSLESETDLKKRDATIAQLWKMLHDEAIYVPIHIQTLAYGMKKDVNIDVDISNQPKMKLSTVGM